MITFRYIAWTQYSTSGVSIGTMIYFDLEYSKSVNPTLNGDGMVVSLIRYVGLELESLEGDKVHLP